jgi:alanyl-tRNA synthetase
VSQILGGKAGGKEDQAQGVGLAAEKLDEAVKAAIEFAKLKLT